MERQIFDIAGVKISLESDVPIAIGTEFHQFCTADKPDYFIRFRKVKELTDSQSSLIQRLMGADIYFDNSSGFIRRFHEEKSGSLPYAVQRCDWKRKTVTVEYLNDGLKNIDHTGGAFFHIAWEDIMLREHRLILHACCVKTQFGGILFSGRSGIGKSTQGNLWCRYEKAELINGDRPILYRTDEVWRAYGSPYAGSSKCHINASVPVRAIIMLQQSDVCKIRRLCTAEAFKKIFAQLTLSTWDPECVRLACDLAEQLITEVPVYELACTPDYDAVELLKKTLHQEVKCDAEE